MKKKGVTLVELLVVLGILSIVAGIAYSILVLSNNIYKKVDTDTSIQDSARNIFMSVGENIKKANYATVSQISLSASNTLTIINSQGNNINVTIPNLLTPISAIYIEDGNSNPFVYAVTTVNGIRELHKITIGSGSTNSIVDRNFESLTFTESNNVFTIEVTRKDNNNNSKYYLTSVSLRDKGE